MKRRDRDLQVAALEDQNRQLIELLRVERSNDELPIPMLLWCPECRARHVDGGEFATKSHHTHACQTCGHVWRPAVVATVGVQFLPGFKDPGGTE
jgi:hypothetical protein